MTYDALLKEVENTDIEVLEIDYKKGINGMSIDNIIGINKNLTTTHKKCVLAEEIGHHYTAIGDILDQTNIVNRKAELKGRQWGYRKLVPLEKLIQAFDNRCTNLCEMAEYLGVTEEFLNEALKYYKSKYGISVKKDNYTIYFEPSLYVVKYFK